MRTFLVSAIIFISLQVSAQQDYFYAENLIKHGQHAEAVRVLDNLIDSGAYADRPRFAMMTLNLAGNTKLLLRDTLGAKKCYESALFCYDTLSKALRADDWNQHEYYMAGKDLAWLHYANGDFPEANNLLRSIGIPGNYYSSSGSDLIMAQDIYCNIRAKVFQKLNQPDSAFHWILKRQNKDASGAHTFDSIFNTTTNQISHVKFVYYSMKSTDQEIKSPGYLYMIAWNDKENLQHSIWFVNPEKGDIKIIGLSTFNLKDPQNFPANCYDISLSPNEQFLAVSCYTEGSNHIDVFSFPEILNEKRCILKQSILAYPSNVEVKGWQKTSLLLECDQDLTRLNKKAHPNWDVTENPDVKMLFLFDPENGKYSKK